MQHIHMRHLLRGPSRGVRIRPGSPHTGSQHHLRNTRRPQYQSRRVFLTRHNHGKARKTHGRSTWPLAVATGGLFVWWLYPSEEFAELTEAREQNRERRQVAKAREMKKKEDADRSKLDPEGQTAWGRFVRNFESFSLTTDLEWGTITDSVADYILPDWSKFFPGYIRKLQRELSMSPGSLADEIWNEAHDPLINPEIRYSADVRVSSDLCDEEKEFLSRRRKYVQAALARYLGLKEEDIHPDDIPTIAMCGSGGGLRALVAGTGSMMAAEEDGLFDCMTYTAGVSGSCWLQMLYLTSFNQGRISLLLDHLKARASTHIAYPPVAFQSLMSLPTSKYLLSGIIEKLMGDPNSDFGLVDYYGILLAARYLVPRGELGVDERDFKISNQRQFIKYGQLPMPIYTAIRHEIPNLETTKEQPFPNSVADLVKQTAKQEAWFQWFEITPYEFFCEEFGAGIPTWALGRKFRNGKDVPLEHGFHLPEIRTPLLMGVFGSAFCATLSHYYREIRPLVRSLTGLGALDEMIWGRNEDLSKVHPIDPAKIPNFAYRMDGQLSKATPDSIYGDEYLQLMDAGMSNNLPIYPLLRPGRAVDVLIAFDASADIKTENWLSVADGYALQRGVKGWPVGIGWPKSDESAAQARDELEEAQAHTAQEVEEKVHKAQSQQAAQSHDLTKTTQTHDSAQGSLGDDMQERIGRMKEKKAQTDLGYCTVWVGSTEERVSEPPPPSKAVSDADTWQLMEPDAGIAVVYLPFLANEAKVPGISPGASDFLSTWNFVYTPEQIDKVVRLARANYDEGKPQILATIRAVYERKKKLRLDAEKRVRQEKLHLIAQRGEAALHKEGDLFG